MPRAPNVPCRFKNCRHLVDPEYRECPVHGRPEKFASVKDRPPAHVRGYGFRWHRYRNMFLNNNPVCSCGSIATVVDHVVPVNGADDPLFWEESNHQALCEPCHIRKTAKEVAVRKKYGGKR